MIKLTSLASGYLQTESKAAHLASLQQLVLDQELLRSALPLDDVLELVGHCRRAVRPVEHPVVQHVPVRALAHKRLGDLVVSLGPHFAQVLFNLFHFLAFRVAGVVMLSLMQTLDFDTFLHLSHQRQVRAVVDKGVICSVHGFALDGDAHVGFAQPRVDFLPVEVLLVNHCFYALWQAPEFKT